MIRPSCSSPQANFVAPSINAIRRLSGSKQGAYNHIVSARIELVRLLILSITDFCAHAGMATIRFSAAVIQLPLCLIMKGLAPRMAFVESSSHAARSLKLALAIPSIPLVGLLHPQSVVNLYQRVGLVERPKDGFSSLLDRATNTFKAVWRSSYRDPILLSAAFIGGLFLRSHYRIAPNDFGRGFRDYSGRFLVLFGIGAAAGWHQKNRLARTTANRGFDLTVNHRFPLKDRMLDLHSGSIPASLLPRPMPNRLQCQNPLTENGGLRAVNNVPLITLLGTARNKIMEFLPGQSWVSLIYTCLAFRDLRVNLAQYMCLNESPLRRDPVHLLIDEMMSKMNRKIETPGHMCNALYGLLLQGENNREIPASQFQLYSHSSEVVHYILSHARSSIPSREGCKSIMAGTSRVSNFALAILLGVENYLSANDCAKVMVTTHDVYHVVIKGNRWRELFDKFYLGELIWQGKNYLMRPRRSLYLRNLVDQIRNPLLNSEDINIAWRRIYNRRYFEAYKDKNLRSPGWIPFEDRERHPSHLSE